MADQARSDKLRRLVAVQRHLERIAEFDLAETGRQRSEVAKQMDNVVTALNSVDPVHQAFGQTYAERFSRLSVKDRQLKGMEQVHEMRLRQERAKGDRLEEGMREAQEGERREAEEAAIEDLIDQRFATPASSKLHKP